MERGLLYNSLGQQLIQKRISRKGAIDFTQYGSGIYLVEVANQEGEVIWHHKLVK
ncbi:MAG: T9SS type A sorting domain-containing protein [Bacteroidetes bacterium]|nr:T9SS type A sorting domain-containing protein [Bacteroidota bacterium]